MTVRVRFRPFTGDGEKTVRLQNAPLELVLCQIRWPEMSFLQGEELRPLALKFGQAMADYPIYSEAQEINYLITPQGVTPTVVGSIFQWVSVDQAWHISLARRFLTLYCTDYSDFEAFSDRLRYLLGRVQELVGIQVVERIGVRYVNRISDPAAIASLPRLIRPEVLGYQVLSFATGEAALKGSANQAVYSVGDASLQVRSGIVPPTQTADPGIAPLDVPSWVLDLDASADGQRIFDVKAIADRTSQLSDIAYDYFKYVITEEFIERFGGEPR